MTNLPDNDPTADKRDTHDDNRTMHDSDTRPNESNRPLDAADAERGHRPVENSMSDTDLAEMQEDMETFEALCEDIAMTMTMPAPRHALKKRIMDAIANLDLNESEPAMPGKFTLRLDEGEWVEALPGIETKHLFRDPETGRTTYMARLQPGATYPDHRHHGVEELVVIEGDIVVGGDLLRAGDYLAALPQTTHHEVYSPSGCLCMVSSMMNDEFI